MAMGGRMRVQALYSVVLLGLSLLLAAVPGFAETITLRWATWGPEDVDRQLIQRFEADHPHIRIEYIPSSWGQHHERVKVLTVGGIAPDVVAVDGVFLLEFVTSNLIQPIDDLLAAESNMSLDDYFPASLPDIQHQGKTYGLPYISAPHYMLYNVDHFEESGLALPDMDWDWDTFETYARALARFDQGTVTRRASSQLLQYGSNAVWPWLWSAGARMFGDDNSFALTQPEAVGALDWLADLNRAGLMGSASFAQQTASITVTYPGGFPSVTGTVWPFTWDVVPHPKGPAGQFSVWKGNVMAISSSTQHREAAWEFVKFLLGPTSPGHEIYVANKRFPPMTRDQDLWKLYQGGTGSEQPSMFEVTMLLATQQGRPLPRLLQWTQIIEQTISPALSRISSGAAPARQVMEEIQPVVEQYLQNEPRF